MINNSFEQFKCKNKFLNFVCQKTVLHFLAVILFYSAIYICFFSPVIFKSELLAPGDGILYYFPAFHWGFDLWNSYIFSGFPQFADPQGIMWYLPKIILQHISFNVFVICAYVFASSFSYGYLYKLTKNIFAAIITGICFGMSGFFMAHLGHTDMIHAASWLPLMIWGIHELYEKYTNRWFILTSFAVSSNILAGHPQIATYSIGVCVIYVLVLSFTKLNKINWKFIGILILVLILGLLLSSIQLLPTIELSHESVRSTMDFATFNSYSLPKKQIIQILFPYLFGGSVINPYSKPYTGPWNLTELTGYIGWLPFILVSCLVFSKNIRNKIVLFWFFVCIFSFLLTLGSATPLASLMFKIPGFNLFRVPARHFMEFCFSISILSGLSIDYIKKNKLSFIKLVLIICGIIIFDLICLLYIKAFLLIDLIKPSVIIPVIDSCISLLIFIWYSSSKRKIFPYVFLTIFLIFDLSSFGWFYEWHSSAPNTYSLKNDLKKDSYLSRIAPFQGSLIDYDNVKPDISQLFGVRSTSGYNPLLLSRYNQLTNITNYGKFGNDNLLNNNHTLDLLSVDKLFFTENNEIKNGIKWNLDDLSTVLKDSNPNTIFNISSFQGNKLFIVSSMANSIGIKQGETVAKVYVSYDDGTKDIRNMIAGRDVSEWAYDRSDVVKIIKHKRAPIFESYNVNNGIQKEFKGHQYMASFKIDINKKIKKIKIQWIGTKPAELIINKLSIFNSLNHQSYPISILSSTNRWKFVKNINENTSEYQNLSVFPRAWFVAKVKTSPASSILNTIQTSKFPSGKSFDPKKTALIEKSTNFSLTGNSNLLGEIQYEQEKNDSISLKVKNNNPAFLVLSDIYYPGWKAYVDGKETKIYRTDYILRGIYVPQGKHTIVLRFMPESFYKGVTLSVLGLFLIVIITLFNKKYPHLFYYSFGKRNELIE